MITACIAAAQPTPAVTRTMGTFEGRPIVVATPKSDATGFHAEGRTTLCLAGPPRRQCYESPEGYGFLPQVKVVQLSKGSPAIFFTVLSGGVSQKTVHLALLRPGNHTELDDLFFSDPSISNFGQYQFWTESALSLAPILVTGESVPGPEECRNCPHRYLISAYLLRRSATFPEGRYYLQDRYMTRRHYDRSDGTYDILAAEKTEILARLKKVAAETKPLLPPSPQD
jgi:hypothetical protein